MKDNRVERPESQIDRKWIKLRDSIKESAVKVVGYKTEKEPRKPWVSQEMVNKMEERRKWKNVNTETGKEKYRQLNNQLRRETEKAKDNWWKEECNALEELARTGKTEKMYNKVSRLTWTKEKTTKGSHIKDNKGMLLTEPDEIRNRWKEYIEVLYDKDGKPENDNMKMEESMDVSEIGRASCRERV